MTIMHTVQDRTHDVAHEISRDFHDLATIGRIEPARQAFVMLWALFTVAPIVVGIDKYFDGLANWKDYLAPWINDIVPGSAHQMMLGVGVVEILAGLLVLTMPRIGAYVLAAWFAGLVVNLVSQGEYYDIALRDFGLMVAALALARLATTFHKPTD